MANKPMQAVDIHCIFLRSDFHPLFLPKSRARPANNPLDACCDKQTCSQPDTVSESTTPLRFSGSLVVSQMWTAHAFSAYSGSQYISDTAHFSYLAPLCEPMPYHAIVSTPHDIINNATKSPIAMTPIGTT